MTVAYFLSITYFAGFAFYYYGTFLFLSFFKSNVFFFNENSANSSTKHAPWSLKMVSAKDIRLKITLKIIANKKFG